MFANKKYTKIETKYEAPFKVQPKEFTLEEIQELNADRKVNSDFNSQPSIVAPLEIAQEVNEAILVHTLNNYNNWLLNNGQVEEMGEVGVVLF